MTDPQAEKLKAFLQARKQNKELEEYATEVGAQVATTEPEHHEEVSISDDTSLDFDAQLVEGHDDFDHIQAGEVAFDETPVEEKVPSDSFAAEEEVLPVVTEPEFVTPEVSEPVVSQSVQLDPVVQPVAEEVAVEEEPSLQDFLKQRREDVYGSQDDDEDPYSGDAIAKRNLKHIQKYLDRDDIADIKEIVINQPNEVGLEFADGHWEWLNDPDLTMDQLDEIARTLANQSGQLFHPGNPILSVKMPGGHRVQVVAGFNAPSGFVFSMRLQRKEKFGLMDFTMPDEEREKIKEIVRSQKTILISGGTGTGKTSFMNALIPSIPDDERLVTMEDVPELRIPHKNWAQLIFSGSDTAMGDQGVVELLNACLRLRPDRIILGEIRKENAFAFCSAINTGHEGSMATIHANSPKMALDAVINRVMMNGDLPDSAIEVLRRQLIHDIYAVVQLTRVHKGVEASLCVLQDADDI